MKKLRLLLPLCALVACLPDEICDPGQTSVAGICYQAGAVDAPPPDAAPDAPPGDAQ